MVYNFGNVNFGKDQYHHKHSECLICYNQTREKDRICIICKIDADVEAVLNSNPIYQIYRDYGNT
jgi:recombinational DNA repair protein RecR